MLSLKVDGPVFISVGEPSGDLYASYLVRDIRADNPGLRVFAIGGENTADKGADVLLDYKSMMTFGFAGGVLSSLRNYSIYKKIARLVYKTRPKTFVGVAYPGLNLLLCKYAKYLGCRVYYFLPPQIWAWGTFRKYFIKQWVDKVISVFPFEYEFYKEMGIDTVFMKNPLFVALKKYKRKDFHTRIGFMPGSRKSEIKRNLPVMIELMRINDAIEPSIEINLIQVQNDLEQKNALSVAMSKLSKRQREAIHLKFYEKMTYSQLAEILEIDLKSSYKLIGKAIDALRKSVRIIH